MTALLPAARRDAGGAWRRHRTALIVGGVALVSAAVFALAVGGSATAEPLDPDNPGSSGARALRQVLQDRGIDVTVVRSAAAFDDAVVDADTTVLVTSTRRLGSGTAKRLRERAQGAELVLAEPGLGIEDALGVPRGSPQALPGPVTADCDEQLVEGLEVDAVLATAYPAPQGCFPVEGGFLLARPEAGVTVLGVSAILANGTITDADHAGIAVRLLGQHERLVWYVPDETDIAAGDAVGLAAALPRWVVPGIWLIGASVLGLMLWRGRRLGPVVTEPLPVSVSALETTLSRGRLYRKAGDRAHAARTLRAAAGHRLSARLSLPPGNPPATLAALLAPRLGRSADELTRLIDPAGPPPTTDRDLIELGSRLDELDREVRRP